MFNIMMVGDRGVPLRGLTTGLAIDAGRDIDDPPDCDPPPPPLLPT